MSMCGANGLAFAIGGRGPTSDLLETGEVYTAGDGWADLPQFDAPRMYAAAIGCNWPAA